MTSGTSEEKVNFIKTTPHYSKKLLCKIVGISESTYQRNKNKIYWDRTLCEFIKLIYRRFPYFGYRKITVMVRRYFDCEIGEHKVRKYCVHLGLNATLFLKKRFNYSLPPNSKVKFANKIKGLKVYKRNQVWTSDITYVLTEDDVAIYRCFVRDKYTGEIIATKISNYFNANLLNDLVEEAILKNNIEPGTLIFHSDHGAQYTSNKFMNLLKTYGVIQSMSKIASPQENQDSEQLMTHYKRCIIDLKNLDSINVHIEKSNLWIAQHNFLPASIYKEARVEYYSDKMYVNIVETNLLNNQSNIEAR